MEVVGMAGLACGMIAVGSCNPDVTATIVQTLMEKSEADLHDTYARFLPLGLGLCHLGELTFTSHGLYNSNGTCTVQLAKYCSALILYD
jgi:hypothetical protein